MAEGSAWAAGDGQGRQRRANEVPWISYRGPPSASPTRLTPHVSGPWGQPLQNYTWLPFVRAENHMQNTQLNPAATGEVHVAQHTMVGPASQPAYPSSVNESAFTIPGGSMFSNMFMPSSPPFIYSPQQYVAPPVSQTYRIGQYNTVQGMPSTYNANPDSPGVQGAPPINMAYPVSAHMTPQSQLGNVSTIARNAYSSSSKGPAGFLPLAPKPLHRAHVSLKTTEAGMMGCIGKGTRRRFDAASLKKVNEIRKHGACLRCRRYKIRCDKTSPCEPCIKVKDSAKVHRGPCVNPRLDTVQAFRAGDGDNRTTVPTLPNLRWPSQARGGGAQNHTLKPLRISQTQELRDGLSSMNIEVTWPFSSDIVSEPPVVRLVLHRFEPTGQSLVEEWTPSGGGRTRTIKLPPLACRDTDTAGRSLEVFLDQCQGYLEKQISAMLQDPIMKMTWREVLRVRDQYRDPTLSKVVRLYAAALMNTRYPKSVRANIFNVGEESEPPFFFEGNLLPPQLTYQIQMLIALGQKNLQKDIIRSLRRLIFHKDRQQHWHAVFLISFVLLSSIELMHHNQTSFLHFKRENSETNRNNVSYVTRHMLAQWEKSAGNLASHFRFVMSGNVLFSQSEAAFEKSTEKACLDEQAIDYVVNMRKEVQGRSGELLEARQSRAHGAGLKGMWATCELFLPDD